MCMRRPHRLPQAITVVALLLLNACGGGGSDPTPVTTTTTLPPPPPQVVAQGALPLEAGFVIRLPFTTGRTGSLEVVVDWTFADNDLDVALVRSDCSFEQFEAQQCPVLTFSLSTTAKPERIRTDGAAAGAYTLFVENIGPGDESFSFQVILTPTATGFRASRVPIEDTGFAFKRKPRGYVEGRVH